MITLVEEHCKQKYRVTYSHKRCVRLHRFCNTMPPSSIQWLIWTPFDAPPICFACVILIPEYGAMRVKLREGIHIRHPTETDFSSCDTQMKQNRTHVWASRISYVYETITMALATQKAKTTRSWPQNRLHKDGIPYSNSSMELLMAQSENKSWILHFKDSQHNQWLTQLATWAVSALIFVPLLEYDIFNNIKHLDEKQTVWDSTYGHLVFVGMSKEHGCFKMSSCVVKIRT